MACASFIADAQHHIRVGPVLEIEERIAPDRDPARFKTHQRRGPLASSEACKRGDVQKKERCPILGDSVGAQASALLLGTPDRR